MLLLMPWAKAFSHQYLLSIAGLVPVFIGIAIVSLNLVFTGQKILVVSPYSISALIYMTFLKNNFRRPLPRKNMIVQNSIVVILMISGGWATWICWLAMDRCFMGACA